MSVCLLDSIGLDGDDIVYDGPRGSHWRLPVRHVSVIGIVAAEADGQDSQLVFVTDPDAAWFVAPRAAVGCDRLLAQLGARLNGGAPFAASGAVTRAGRALWPSTLAGQEIFEHRAGRAILSSTLRAALRIPG